MRLAVLGMSNNYPPSSKGQILTLWDGETVFHLNSKDRSISKPTYNFKIEVRNIISNSIDVSIK